MTRASGNIVQVTHSIDELFHYCFKSSHFHQNTLVSHSFSFSTLRIVIPLNNFPKVAQKLNACLLRIICDVIHVCVLIVQFSSFSYCLISCRVCRLLCISPQWSACMMWYTLLVSSDNERPPANMCMILCDKKNKRNRNKFLFSRTLR